MQGVTLQATEAIRLGIDEDSIESSHLISIQLRLTRLDQHLVGLGKELLSFLAALLLDHASISHSCD